MDKKILGLATLSAVALAAGVEARAAEVMNPQSYAELLQPIPEAVSLLASVDDLTSVKVEKVQWPFPFGHHHHHNWHHHHHHGWFHHHHHHHHHGWFHHHHHHHHH